MTAVVGVLNKSAVAIATDSAVTITMGASRKILNGANKLFSLSKYQPIGIAIYNSALFMGVPWETIIKLYREHLGTQAFRSLSDYQKNFIQFLRDNNFYSTSQEEEKSLLRYAWSIIKDIQDNKRDVKELAQYFSNEKSKNTLVDFETYGYETFKAKYLLVIEEFILNESENLINAEFKQEFKQDTENYFIRLLFHLIGSSSFFPEFTGLVFVGFGFSEIYPNLIPVNVSFVLEGKLRYYIDEEKKFSVTNQSVGNIIPFAQTDVIETLLYGISPEVKAYYEQVFKDYFSKFYGEISNIIAKNGFPQITTTLEKLKVGIIDNFANEFRGTNQYIRNLKEATPLKNSVAMLSKEDLAEIAESLISLTTLKRRMKMDEESVGGPVDVAVISKGEGFIWIKRKHYFRAELNPHYFNKP